jgi:hypothetical protein
MNLNQSKYKSLKAKVFNNKKAAYTFEQTLSSVMRQLLPPNQDSNKTSQSAPLKNKENQSEQNNNNTDKRMNALVEKLSESEKKSASSDSRYKKQIEGLGKRIYAGDKENLELSNNLKKAIENIKSKKVEDSKVATEENKETQKNSETSEDDLSKATMLPSNPYTLGDPTGLFEPADISSPSLQKVVERSFAIDDYFKVGKYKYRVSNTFGLRKGANAVTGISTNAHSGGIDLVGYNEKGENNNSPISLTNGTILGVVRDGDGSVIKPEEGAFGGYMIRVLMDDGKIMTYMHLGKDVWDQRNKLRGKKINRGDLLFEGNNSSGSGSQTAPHTKVRVSSRGLNGGVLQDHKEPINDPTIYALHGEYIAPEE